MGISELSFEERREHTTTHIIQSWEEEGYSARVIPV